MPYHGSTSSDPHSGGGATAPAVSAGASNIATPAAGVMEAAIAGLKAGGPNYVAQFMKFQETPAQPGDEPLSNPALERLALNIVNESCGVPEEQYWRTLKAMERH